jgi:hypothetical protein
MRGTDKQKEWISIIPIAKSRLQPTSTSPRAAIPFSPGTMAEEPERCGGDDKGYLLVKTEFTNGENPPTRTDGTTGRNSSLDSLIFDLYFYTFLRNRGVMRN